MKRKDLVEDGLLLVAAALVVAGIWRSFSGGAALVTAGVLLAVMVVLYDR